MAVVPIRWVCVLGTKGLEDAYFYSSQQNMDARRIVELYAMRWNIEVTFEETRAIGIGDDPALVQKIGAARHAHHHGSIHRSGPDVE